MFTIVVEADINDADYITNEFVVNEKKFIYIQEICTKIRKSKIDHRVSVENEEMFRETFKDALTELEIDYLHGIVPTAEGYGVLEEIRFYIGEPVRLL